MVLSGWWEASNDSVSVATVSEQFIKENPDMVQNTYAVDHEMSGGLPAPQNRCLQAEMCIRDRPF